MSRAIAIAATALALGGCAGRITARDMPALGRYRDRPIVLAPAVAEGPFQAVTEEARRGAEASLASVVTSSASAAPPDALTIEVTPLLPGEGHRSNLLLVPAMVIGEVVPGTRVVRDAAGVYGVGQMAYDATRVRFALVLRDPRRRNPLGGVVWEGFRGHDASETAEKAGRVAGEALAQDIVEQRSHFVTRRPGDERLLLTPTPLLLRAGEKVVSNDELLIFHAGMGVKGWLQIDVTLGALPVPIAGGVVYADEGLAIAAGGAGAVVLGAIGLGAKVRVLEEDEKLPGVSLAYDMVDVWGGGLGGGGVVLLGKGLAWAGGMAGAGGTNIQLNVFTVAASKHPRDWLHVGAGGYIVDNHAFMPEGSGIVIVDSTGTVAGGVSVKSDRIPTTLLPFLSAEAAVGSHFRFISEYLAAPGPDYLSLGVRAVLYGGGSVAGIRRDGFKLRFDLAAIFTDGKNGIDTLPWLGAGLYL